MNLEIDQAVFNPARITKLYGTKVQKGDSTPDRPHRLARIISLPEARTPVPIELLKTIAQAAGNQEAPRDKVNGGADGFDLAAYLAYYGVEVVKVKPHGGGQLYCLEQCLFDPSHTGNEAAIGQAANGLLYYQCFHKSCKRKGSGYTWFNHDPGQLMAGAQSHS